MAHYLDAHGKVALQTKTFFLEKKKILVKTAKVICLSNFMNLCQ